MNRLLLILSLCAFTVSGSLGALYWQSLETRRDLATRNSALDGQLAASRELTASFQKQAVPLGAGLSSAAVVRVGAESSFVVLNYGSARGAVIGQKFVIRNGSDILGSALISDVRSQFSVAQVEPDSLHGVLHKGDLAILTP